MQTLLWSDIKEIIKNLFDEYDGNYGLRWIEKVWGITISRGEADYLTIYEKNQVQMRLISLILLYAEFKSIFFYQASNLFLENIYEFLDKNRLHMDEKLICTQPTGRDLFFEILQNIINTEKKKYCKILNDFYSKQDSKENNEIVPFSESLTRDIIRELIIADDFETLFYITKYKKEEIDEMREEEFYEKVARVNTWIESGMQNTD